MRMFYVTLYFIARATFALLKLGAYLLLGVSYVAAEVIVGTARLLAAAGRGSLRLARALQAL